MRVHEVTDAAGHTLGYRLGARGRVFKSKARADALERSVFCSRPPTDPREDAAVRTARRKVAHSLRPNAQAELAYKKAIVRILRGVHEGVMGMLEREVLPAKVQRRDGPLCDPPGERGPIRQPIGVNAQERPPLCENVDHLAGTSTSDARDESPTDRAKRILSPRLREKIAKHVRKQVGPAFDSMAESVDKKNKRAMTLIGIPIAEAAADVVAGHLRGGANVAGKFAELRENNIRLVEDAGRDYADDVRKVFTDNRNAGLRPEELIEKLMARGKVWESRARLIAVDQTLKLSSSLTQARQRAAGVGQYRWSTSRDERVRGNPGGLYPKADPSHFDLEGQVFSWDNPPPANVDGSPANPGEAILCRCVAIPVIPELDEAAAGEMPMEAAAEE